MNILPLILALVLMLSILTIEKLEKFKNQNVIQTKYQTLLKKNEDIVFNLRQKNLYESNQRSLRQLSFRFFVDKKAREDNQEATKQYRLLTIELMKIVYGEATFFKNLEKKRPHFLEEMLNAIEKTADAAPKGLIKGIKDIARLKLEDPELQEAFYHMLKGTISREDLKKEEELTPHMKEKAYVSLFTFIHYHGKDSTPTIKVQLAPREILKAIFVSDAVVEAILTRRNELAATKDKGVKVTFANEFKDKRREGISDSLLDFSISFSNKTKYN